MPRRGPTRAGFLGAAGASLVLCRAAARAADVPYGRVLERYFRAGTFDGVALIGIGDRIVYRGAAGLADRARRRPHAIDETFRIASVTKQFTALLAMQEVERGRVDLDAPLDRAVPGLPADVAPITLRQLLKNTSGLPNLDAIPGAYTRVDAAMDDLPAYVRALPLVPLTARPGTKFSYNNLDYLLAGALLQSVTGKPFATLVGERVIVPLGLHATGVYGAAVPDSHVKGYEDANGRLVDESIGRLANFGPAGAMYSSLGDLFRWDRALHRNALLGAAATAEMFRADAAFGYVGLGSWSYDLTLPTAAKLHVVERQGNIGGIQVLNVFAPAADLTMIVLANTDFAALFDLYSRRGLPYELLSLAATGAA